MNIDIDLIEQAFNDDLQNVDKEAVEENIRKVFDELNNGGIRVAYLENNDWHVNQWIKKAILLSFKLKNNKLTDIGYTKFYDKLSSKFETLEEDYLKKNNIRVVPQAVWSLIEVLSLPDHSDF